MLFDNHIIDIRHRRCQKYFNNKAVVYNEIVQHIGDNLSMMSTLCNSDKTIKVCDIDARNGKMLKIIQNLNPNCQVFYGKPFSDLIVSGSKIESLDQNQWREFFNLVTAPLTLHRSNDLMLTLSNINAALCSGGIFVGNFLGPATLQELKDTVCVVDSHYKGRLCARVSPMVQMQDVQMLLSGAKFSDIVVHNDVIRLQFKNFASLCKFVQHHGESNFLTQQNQTLCGKMHFKRIAEYYHEYFSLNDGDGIYATCEILYFLARKK